MFNLILIGLARLTSLLRQTRLVPVPHPWINEDSGWHLSSFELARGLEVIEHRGLPPLVFADTMPAFQPARA
jgi:hypothetical protein